MYSTYNLLFIGLIILLIYIIVDVIKNKTDNLFRRLIFYSFIFYLLCIAQLTTGGIAFPPQNDYGQIIQLIPFYFIIDWLRIYDYNGFDWFFWNSVKLSFYNLIMLAPLGVYLSILFQHTKISKVFLIVFLISLTIEISQLILGYFGFVLGRGTNVDDLILNTLGGVIGFILMQFLKRLYDNKFKNNH